MQPESGVSTNGRYWPWFLSPENTELQCASATVLMTCGHPSASVALMAKYIDTKGIRDILSASAN